MQKIIKMKVKSKTEILKWLKANGYRKERKHYYTKSSTHIDIIPEMFACCGKILEFRRKNRHEFEEVKNYRFVWRKEWLEAVKTTYKRGRKIETMNQLSAYMKANGKIYFGAQVLNSAFVQNFYFHTLDMAVRNSVLHEVVEVVK